MKHCNAIQKYTFESVRDFIQRENTEAVKNKTSWGSSSIIFRTIALQLLRTCRSWSQARQEILKYVLEKPQEGLKNR